MARPKELFDACIARLDRPNTPEAQCHGAPDLLEALGYLPERDGSAEDLDETRNRNRHALIRLASQFEDIFSMPLPHAPGAAFFGALVAPRSFGILGHGPDPSGVGGRGTTLREAFESCIGEAAEYLSFIEWDEDERIGRDGGDHGLSPDEVKWALAGMGLASNEDFPAHDWVGAYALHDERRVRFPSELVLRRPLHLRKGGRAAESNGVGAGATFDDAVRSGLLEAVERDAIALWWFGGRPAGKLAASVEASSAFQTFLHATRGDGGRSVWFLDLTNDLGIPVVAALSAETDGSAAVAGFSAHPDPLAAARGALLELCQMELAQQISLYKWREMPEAALKDMDRIWIERFDSLSLDNHPRLGPAAQVNEVRTAALGSSTQDITAHLKSAGFEPYAVDLTRPQINLPVARILVPGLQSAKPDWLSTRLIDAARANGMDMADVAQGPCPI